MARRAQNAFHDFYIDGVLRARLNTRRRAEGYPRTHIKRIGGFWSQGDLDTPAPDTPSGRRGEVPYPATTRGNSLTYELQQQADSEPDLNTSMRALRAGFSDVSSLGLLVLTPWPGHGTDIWASFCRVVAFDCDEELVYSPDESSYGHYGPWKLDPTLSLRQVDGVWLWINEADPGTPFTPLSVSGEPGVVVSNSGTTDTPPLVTVNGVNPGEDLHLIRAASGVWPQQELWFRDPVGVSGLTGARDVIVDFTALPRRVWVSGVDVTDSYDATASDWWDEYVPGIPPGSFNVSHGPGAGTGITVAIYSADS